jgi:23S rRNA maturation mini-RNase III
MISKELIDYLEKQFPNKSPDLNDNERKIWFKAGQSSVVSHLKKILDDKENNILKETVIGDIK